MSLILPSPKDVDARHKAGHDDGEATRFNAMAVLVPAIHVFGIRKSWMLRIKPGKTRQPGPGVGRSQTNVW